MNSMKPAAVDVVPQQQNQAEQLSRKDKAKLAVERLMAAESMAAESPSIRPSRKIRCTSNRCENVEHKPKQKAKQKIRCMSHERSRCQWLVRTGKESRTFKYSGRSAKFATEEEAKKAAAEFFELSKNI